MAADPLSIISSIASGLLTGGASAGTTFLAVFRDIKKRITDLEKKLGDEDSEPPTGVYFTLDSLTKSVRALRNEISSWRDEPPDWLVRIVQRANRGSMNLEHWSEFEQRIEQRLNNLRSSLQRLEEEIDRKANRLEDEIGKSSPELSAFVTREEYQRDSVRRADEMRKIRENLKSANSFLKGVLTALGYIDPPVDIPIVVEEAPTQVAPRPLPKIIPTPGRPLPVPPPKKK